ncbi:MAG TPA: class I SAM-dependent methyltransferase [Polynucleobacter sp.]|nr:class I SAM-dependent methyltransferase [Polynucleobacter sp.]HQS60624.1 class I SAM-dependent methyltransferase [Polynucleobacter sp.]HQT40871.1 class I SAM-dependent methyltransferase [Polynucleobacter sp.]
MNQNELICWDEGGESRSAMWHSENGIAAHKRIRLADDAMTADEAHRLACEGTALLWRGDFQNARQLLQALMRRVDKPSKKSKRLGKRSDKSANLAPQKTPLDLFNQHRLIQSQRARVLGMLLIPCNPDHTISLRRAPDVALACLEAFGPASEPYVISLRELLGVISAHEWRKHGLPVLADSSGEPIVVHPHYGVFSPIRGEYLELVCNAPLPNALDSNSIAFDIGVGTGVLSVILAMRGVQKIVATDLDERALVCAAENIQRLNLDHQVEVAKANLFPEGKAALVVCNPPWLPARPSSRLEHAVYDPDSQMLKGFLMGLKNHLLDQGEGWLILSDLAEHLGMRTRKQLLDWIEQAGLQVLGHIDTKPKHSKAFDESDPLYFARSAEVTSLWRLGIR